MEAGHEIAHVQQWHRTLRRIGDYEKAYEEFFVSKPFGSKGYAFDEMVAERLGRMRTKRYFGDVSPQQTGAATKYIEAWKEWWKR
jgi:hypothetical protein